ncbi:hypothetical protein THAOC_22767 [Thalassiosira oceanica]|uniref:Uncharacterized protein n=1 Tax=Thalassiosira oceanica TaxID=159749 RepID=K0SF44_THAOC|nr:hypothetical protein THAOC_22767 [Thalassiosira oceanica]|eukprot:EJK57217.1 hypothetical protein THAOC_22767 [Thalassiosira oceanica]
MKALQASHRGVRQRPGLAAIKQNRLDDGFVKHPTNPGAEDSPYAKGTGNLFQTPEAFLRLCRTACISLSSTAMRRPRYLKTSTRSRVSPYSLHVELRASGEDASPGMLTRSRGWRSRKCCRSFYGVCTDPGHLGTGQFHAPEGLCLAA